MITYPIIGVWLFMTLIWLISIRIKNVSIVDTIFGLNYIIIHIAYLVQNPTLDITNITLFITTTLWAIRLSLHIGIKNAGMGEEKRYQRFRQNYGPKRYWWFSYFQVFILQGVFLLIFASPIHISYLTTTQQPLLPLYLLGLGLFTFGFFYEAIADIQLYRFKRTHSSKQFISTGLWRFSRHPNYFGELVLWFGMAGIAMSKSPTLFSTIALIGPIFQSYVMTQLSGPKNHEPHMVKEKPGFLEYQQHTPSLIPNFFINN